MSTPFTRWRHRLHERATRRWSEPIATRRRRLGAWLSMMLADHGFIRLVRLNRHRVTERMWRSAQPAPWDVAAARRAGVRTILNLRGGTIYGSTALEREACAREGLAYAVSVVYSRAAPSREQVHRLLATFRAIETPVLIHCKSGADRAGLAAVLWMLVMERRPIEAAVKQLSLRYGHVPAGKTGILDAFFDEYRRANAAAPIDFVTWLDTVYDPDALTRRYRSGFWGNLLVDRVLRRE